MKVGDSIELTVESNGTTGYMWSVTPESSDVYKSTIGEVVKDTGFG